MPILQKIILEFGLPGLLGMGLGLWLFGTAVKGSNNILDQAPWNPIASAVVGGIVFGIAFYFILGLCLGLSI